VTGVFNDGAVGEQNALIDFDGAPLVEAFAGAFFADGVLKPARRFNSVGLLPVFLEEGFGFGTVPARAAASALFAGFAVVSASYPDFLSKFRRGEKPKL